MQFQFTGKFEAVSYAFGGGLCSLVENMVKKNRSCFAITVLLTTNLKKKFGW